MWNWGGGRMVELANGFEVDISDKEKLEVASKFLA